MMYFTPFPPNLYEILDCSLFVSSLFLFLLCLRYLVTAYLAFRIGRRPLQALYELRTLRLAVGMTIFLAGLVTRWGFLWSVRYLQNTGHDVAWISQGWMNLFPVLGSVAIILGFGCASRAIVPEVWGRYGYVSMILITLAVVTATQIIR